MTSRGGNQQKSILARWLMRGCRLLVCIEPTRGVDVGAKREIYRELEGLAQDGTGILVVSTDLPEVLGIATGSWSCSGDASWPSSTRGTATEQDLLLAMQGGPADGRTACRSAHRVTAGSGPGQRRRRARSWPTATLRAGSRRR